MSSVHSSKYKPDTVSPPGDTLLEAIEMHGLSQAQLAERTGRPKKTINEIIQGKAAITPETAMQLELVLGISASFWLSREAKYREWLARAEENARLDLDLEFVSHLPMKRMMELGWIENYTDKRSKAKATLGFFGVVDSHKIPHMAEAAFRRSELFATNPWALAAWLRKGEIEALKIAAKSYDKITFIQTLKSIRKLTTKAPKEFVPEMTKLCAAAGVALVFVQELPKTSVSGATRWLGPDRPLIQLSLRHKCNDMFWFSFFHECGHVIHEHAKREILLENKFAPSLDQREEAANQFATEFLLPTTDVADFLATKSIAAKSISEFAESQEIAEGIVVGRLQFLNKIKWNQYQNLKKIYLWEQWPEGSYY